MCIIICFPKGSDKTSDKAKEAIRQGITSNRQSSGYCYRKAGEDVIHLKKGFLKETPEQVAEHIIGLNLAPEDVLIVHGRIPTDGGGDASQAHPFICSADPEEACMIEGTTKKPVLAHNGMFSKLGSTRYSQYSDTALFAMKIASDPIQMALMKKNPDKAVEIYKNYNMWGWSKVAILLPEKDTDIIYLGEGWISDKTLDIKASNNGYKSYAPNRGGLCSNPSLPSTKEWTDRVTGRVSSVNDGPIKNATKATYYSGGSKEGSVNTFSDTIFRRDFYNHAVLYSNNRIIPNIFNYLFLSGSLSYPILTNKIIPHNVPYTLSQNKRESFKIINFEKQSNHVKVLFDNGISDEYSYSDVARLCTFTAKFNYVPALNFDDPTVSPNIIQRDNLHFREDLYNAFETYENLIISSSHEPDGSISKSYAKKLYHILDSHIVPTYFSTKLLPYTLEDGSESEKKRLINIYSKDKTKLVDTHSAIDLMEAFTKKTTKHTINTNKGQLIHDASLLGLFLYYIERSQNVGTSFLFEELQIKRILCAEARKLNLLYTIKLPALTSNTQQELILND